jgi:hypothetical protein
MWERLRGSLLKLNQEIAAEREWDEEAIKRRAARLAQLAVSIWPPASHRSPGDLLEKSEDFRPGHKTENALV